MIHEATEKIVGEADLTRAEAEAVMEQILSGRATNAQIAGFLTALRIKGETVDELVGFATVMRRHASPVFSKLRLPPNAALVDTAGTGGDARGTFNISTAAAFVIAGAGALVAKHGNRAFTSRCGSADVLEELGVRMDLPMERVARAIEEIGIGFLYAPAAHTAMRHAMTARRELKVRTVFNLLGPLTNPAGAQSQVLGVFSEDVIDLVAAALAELGVERAFVVHGAGGLDEISLAGETLVTEVHGGGVRRFTVAPEEFGVERAPLEAIRGGTATQNAALIRRILEGEAGPTRDIVVINAAAALVAAGMAENFREAAGLASFVISSGAAAEKLASLVEFTSQS